MIATRLKGTVTKDRRLEVKVPRSVSPGKVEVVLIRESPEPRGSSRPRKANHHPAAGLWRNRTDIGETTDFVMKLRRRMQARGDARR